MPAGPPFTMSWRGIGPMPACRSMCSDGPRTDDEVCSWTLDGGGAPVVDAACWLGGGAGGGDPMIARGGWLGTVRGGGGSWTAADCWPGSAAGGGAPVVMGGG